MKNGLMVGRCCGTACIAAAMRYQVSAPTRTTQDTLNYYVTSIRDILLGIYKGNEQKLGDWGFTVDQSPQAKRTPAQAKA